MPHAAEEDLVSLFADLVDTETVDKLCVVELLSKVSFPAFP